MKKNLIIKQFLIWLRNGVCFCMTWFIILLLLFSKLFGYKAITMNTLGKLLLLTLVGVCLFNLFFIKGIIKKWSFTQRLTGFMLVFSILEALSFYWIGLFTRSGTLAQWLAFIGIVLVLYFMCIGINFIYGKRQEARYSSALKAYQASRDNH